MGHQGEGPAVRPSTHHLAFETQLNLFGAEETTSANTHDAALGMSWHYNAVRDRLPAFWDGDCPEPLH